MKRRMSQHENKSLSYLKYKEKNTMALFESKFSFIIQNSDLLLHFNISYHIITADELCHRIATLKTTLTNNQHDMNRKMCYKLQYKNYMYAYVRSSTLSNN